MSRKSRMQSAREAKDRRMKMIAIGGAVLLAILLAFELPHYLGKSSSTPPAATNAVGTTTSGTTTTPTTTPGVTPVVAAPSPTANTALPNSDVLPRQSKYQLTGFSTFASKDPFIQQVSSDTGTTGSTSGSGSAATSDGTGATSGSAVQTSARVLAHRGAVTISVNGRPQRVRVGASFPSANPIFRLVSVKNGLVRIGIANGQYASGAPTIALRLNSPMTLVDTSSGARYKLELLLRS
jgi:hypothetical protein